LLEESLVLIVRIDSNPKKSASSLISKYRRDVRCVTSDEEADRLKVIESL
jgi:hypothetical protein